LTSAPEARGCGIKGQDGSLCCPIDSHPTLRGWLSRQAARIIRITPITFFGNRERPLFSPTTLVGASCVMIKSKVPKSNSDAAFQPLAQRLRAPSHTRRHQGSRPLNNPIIRQASPLTDVCRLVGKGGGRILFVGSTATPHRFSLWPSVARCPW